MSGGTDFIAECVYTILHSDRLHEMYNRGGSAKLFETKKWSTGYGLFCKAKNAGRKMMVVYAGAEDTRDLIYYATIKDITITSDDHTEYSIENLIPINPPRPKHSLILRSTGRNMDQWYIRPYAICQTPDFLLEKNPVAQESDVKTNLLSLERNTANNPQHVAPRNSQPSKLKLKTFQLGTPRESNEGIRIGVVRHPPRGVRKEDYARLNYYDVWLPALAPSRKLLDWAQKHDLRNNWKGFVQRYESEMIKQTDSRQSLILLAKLAEKTPIAVGCHCSDESFCHRSILYQLIERAGRNEF